MKITTCGSCPAKIIWTVTAKGKRMPVDAEPVLNGNIDVLPGDPPTSNYLTPFADMKAYVSHFVTCPSAQKYRKAR